MLMNNTFKKRLYDSQYRKKLLSKIDSINDKNVLLIIYNYIVCDIGNNFSSNTNGIFININILSNNCIEKINTYVDEIINKNIEDSKIINVVVSTPYVSDDIEILTDLGHKFSNQEKNIIKRIRNKL